MVKSPDTIIAYDFQNSWNFESHMLELRPEDNEQN